ncbi:Glutathione S-transferase A, putative [Perkinsus marinus ATCC 50983]|uniref:Glutathione S-transferase A, putative n=1 Tax=Perkinsus marinus (strain ATCC 50983 / TXsc) TaxID=423536 RepID=C5KBL7_PERM5|nr:Glutathione S-transferase A, putative [Perkinsus marinus ATCC 50983]EER18137.1 Glutathione S-transferase A, putative [Perkinsus marinus ATCC 50983]|eukprot:XP_002786341.1 Glutathione S-transferase A, putative [Perkinsus marinus ATCC 50983]
MSQLTLFTYSPSNNCMRVEIVLKEKNLPYERKEVDIFKGEQKTPQFLAMNPRGTVPCLTHGSLVLRDSMAALQYLDMAFPDQVPLTPHSPAEMAACIQYIHEFEQSFNPKNVAYQVFFQGQKKEQLGAEIEALSKEVAIWDGYLEGKEYLVGNFTLADIAVFPLVAQLHLWLGLNLDKYPNMKKWYFKMKERHSVKDHPYFECAERVDQIFGTIAKDRAVLKD